MCFSRFSHYTDICALLTPWDRAGCPRVLERHRIPCSCPFQPGMYSLPRLTIHIPKMEGILSMLAKVRAKLFKVCEGYVFTGVCLSTGEGVSATHTPVDKHPLGRHRHIPPGKTSPSGQTPLCRHPLANTSLGRPPPVDTPLPSACWDTPPAQCILEYGQQADGMHLTGMHSCFDAINSILIGNKLGEN